STGGDWGWVTIVIRDDEMDFDKWQNFMDQCREKHLVPLVRIATHNENTYWVKPKEEDAQKWADFLSSLNWPTQDQYVILFNEPNHAKEWGGEINPKEYAQILSTFRDELKDKSEKFKILNAGLDLAAPNGKETMEAYLFMQEMNQEVPEIFEKLDGWCSHSYPNHGYKGKPWESGKVSIKGYEWELSILQKHFGLQKQLPIFITETGWPTGTKYEIRKTRYGTRKVAVNKYYDGKTAAEYLKYTFENVWLKDSRVKAVTPFVLNYPSDLFINFSWFNEKGEPQPQFEVVKTMPKENWWPKQENKYEIKSIFFPSFLPTNEKYKGKMIIKNTGQAIWGEKGPVEIQASTNSGLLVSDLVLGASTQVKPGETTQVDFSIISTDEDGVFEISWGELPKFELKVLPSSIITTTRYTLWEKLVLKVREVFGV
ncbi:MAG: hypothetical protein ACOX50_04125, partial [Patescibacteria group bacterium]